MDSHGNDEMRELDMIHHCMNDLSEAVKDKEKARYEGLCREFGMN